MTRCTDLPPLITSLLNPDPRLRPRARPSDGRLTRGAEVTDCCYRCSTTETARHGTPGRQVWSGPRGRPGLGTSGRWVLLRPEATEPSGIARTASLMSVVKLGTELCVRRRFCQLVGQFRLGASCALSACFGAGHRTLASVPLGLPCFLCIARDNITYQTWERAARGTRQGLSQGTVRYGRMA